MRGRRVLASYACAALVAIARCSGPVADGAPIDTSTAGPHQFDVSATDANGVTAVVTAVYDVLAPAPLLSGVRESAVRWLGRAGAKSRLPVGTTFSFTLGQDATVTLRFTRIVGGRLAGAPCHAGARRGAPCTIRAAAGSVTVHLLAGARTLRFDAATSAGRLAPGVYAVSIGAVGRHGRSATRTLRFTIANG